MGVKNSVGQRILFQESPMGNLFHYTNFKGLEGILRDQCLWATDFKTMNDSSELKHGLEYINQVAEGILKDVLKGRSLTDQGKAVIKFHGGEDKFIKAQANFVTESLIEGSVFRTIGNAFIASFCEHELGEIQKDGLLSQWRGYGKEQGYAIEFNNKFNELLKNITKDYSVWMVLGDDLESPGIVEYIKEKDFPDFKSKFKKQIPKIEKFLKVFYESKMNGIEYDSSGLDSCELAGLQALVESLSFCKHFGFHEESERRIVFCVNKDLNNIPQEELNKMPKIKIYENGNGVLRNYIELFEDSKIPLSKAINRILVGPSKNKDNNKEKLQTMLRELGGNYSHIKVDVSTIPFI